MANQQYMGDPSGIRQHFPRLSADICCCRFWWLRQWEYNRLSFPIWRIYYNFNEGAVITYEHKEFAMKPDTIYLIAPNTDYQSRISGHPIPRSGSYLEGGDIGSIDPSDREHFLAAPDTIRHLFIHFILTPTNDKVVPGIHAFPLTAEWKQKIHDLCEYLTTHYASETFDMPTYWLIQSLIADLLRSMDKWMWKPAIHDPRVSRMVDYIEHNYDQELSNKLLANMVCMSPNSFSRLFKQHMGIQLQKYIQKKRIDRACFLLITSDLTIDEITYKTGFQNRFHFTRLFRELTGTTPAKYKKSFA